jgi:hypothetical protein
VTIDSFVNLLAEVTLFEMMVTIGWGVTLAEIAVDKDNIILRGNIRTYYP